MARFREHGDKTLGLHSSREYLDQRLLLIPKGRAFPNSLAATSQQIILVFR
jgi:hypothetical protein